MKPPPHYLTRAQVERLCRANGISMHKCRIIFGADCPARKCLRAGTRPVYVRMAVLELLGLT